MDLTSLDLPEKRVLRALFELARCDHPAQPDVLARALDLDHVVLLRALTSLAQRGLADATRVRLTLPGLAAAVRVPPLGREVLVAAGVQVERDDEAEAAPRAPWLRAVEP